MNKVHEIRLAKGMAQQELAIRAGVGQAMLTGIERYDYCPGLRVRTKIAEALGVRPEEIWPEAEERINVR